MFNYFLKLAFYKEKANQNSHQFVSVIVAAHNEYENLKKLIPAILAQSYHQFELIIVNDRSSDETEDYLKDKIKIYGEKLKMVTVENTPAKMDPKKYALTLGIKAAKYEFLLFTDADCLPYNDKWILQMQSKFSHSKSIVIGISQYVKEAGFLNLFIRLETFYTCIQYLSFAIKGSPYMGVGRNLAYTKNDFFSHKGFHPFNDVTGGDDDLFIQKVATKENTTIAIAIESQTNSLPKKTWKDWMHQKNRHLSVGKFYNTQFTLSIAFLNISHIVSYVLFILLLIDSNYLYYSSALYLLKILINLIIFSIIIKKLRYNINGWSTIVFELLYPIYYLYAGTSALLTKKVRWK